VLSDLEAVKAALSKAASPEDVFGKLDGKTSGERKHALAVSYRRLVAVVHPDHNTSNAAHASELFRSVTEWKAKAESKIDGGTYGDYKPHVAAPPPPDPVGPQIIKMGKRTYVVQDLIASGDLADIYSCTFSEKATDVKCAFKVVQSAGDNDLIENESKVLRAMYPEKQVEEKFYRYLPKLYDTFMLKTPGTANRRVNVLQHADGYVTLADVIRAYPKGLDYRDVVWMFKRVLAAMWFVHSEKKVVHGALIPPHIMIHPTGHGAKIVDWSYAVSDWPSKAGRVKAISKAYKIFYPQEILDKKPVTPATDIYMIGKCAVALLGGDLVTNQMPDTVPKPVRAFVSGLLLGAQARRPDDAGKLHEEFDELLVKLVGKPKYRPLAMPASGARSE
jgi:serine/threonine protein kinase